MQRSGIVGCGFGRTVGSVSVPGRIRTYDLQIRRGHHGTVYVVYQRICRQPRWLQGHYRRGIAVVGSTNSSTPPLIWPAVAGRSSFVDWTKATEWYFLPMTTRSALFGLLLGASMAVAACGNGGQTVSPGSPRSAAPSGLPSTSAEAPSASAPTGSSSASTAAPDPTGPPRLKLGQAYRGNSATVTIRSAKVGGSADDYESGAVWLYTDVRFCNTGREAVTTPSWGMWILKTRDGYEVKPADITPEPREPALPYDSAVSPEDCVRGWLTFAPPKKSRMSEIRLVEDALFGDQGPVIASWR